ncbi:MAG: stalk domain-containing protein [Oscillospiraceae bacterium]
MKRNFLALLLGLTLMICQIPVAAAQEIAPTPPAWCPAEEYAIFAGSQAYQGKTWETILALRKHAEAGNVALTSKPDTVLYNRHRALEYSKDPGVQFEFGLVEIKYRLNAIAQGKETTPSSKFEFAAREAAGQPEAVYLCRLWNARLNLATREITTGLDGEELRFYVGAIEPLLSYPQFTLDAVYNCDLAKALSPERMAYAKSIIFVSLDGKIVHPHRVRYSMNYVDTTTAQLRNSRTMVPVRRLAELMGATVGYDSATGQITIQRAGDTFVMTLGSTQALRNGTAFSMDTAPYVEQNRTYIPIRYIAEFFGQQVDWNGSQQHVVITEDKTVAGKSNLEAWALAMGAALNYENNSKETALFGAKSRFGAGPTGREVSNRLETTGVDFGRQTLRDGWHIIDRAALLAQADTLAKAPNQTYPAWDAFRVSHLAQWGYLSGYVTYKEALAMVEPAAQVMCKHFASWDEAYASYLSGYYQWAGATAVDRAGSYAHLKADPALRVLFDDTLFQTGVIGLPQG